MGKLVYLFIVRVKTSIMEKNCDKKRLIFLTLSTIIWSSSNNSSNLNIIMTSCNSLYLYNNCLIFSAVCKWVKSGYVVSKILKLKLKGSTEG